MAVWYCPRCGEETPIDPDPHFCISPGTELCCKCGQIYCVAFEQLNDPDEEE